MANSPISRYNCKKRWFDKMMANPGLHEKYKKQRREYYRKNRKRILMYQRGYYKELRELSKEIENCTSCF